MNTLLERDFLELSLIIMSTDVKFVIDCEQIEKKVRTFWKKKLCEMSYHQIKNAMIKCTTVARYSYDVSFDSYTIKHAHYFP